MQLSTRIHGLPSILVANRRLHLHIMESSTKRGSNSGSGKKPTKGEGQIKRKRELDRIAQRVSRERFRNRIEFLEEKLKAYESNDQESHISQLMKMNEDLRMENTQLRAMMMKIGFICDSASKSDWKSK